MFSKMFSNQVKVLIISANLVILKTMTMKNE